MLLVGLCATKTNTHTHTHAHVKCETTTEIRRTNTTKNQKSRWTNTMHTYLLKNLSFFFSQQQYFLIIYFNIEILGYNNGNYTLYHHFFSPLSLHGCKMSAMMSPSHIQKKKTNSKWGATEPKWIRCYPTSTFAIAQNQIKCVTTENQTPLPLNLFRYYNDYHHHHQFLSLCLLLSPSLSDDVRMWFHSYPF